MVENPCRHLLANLWCDVVGSSAECFRGFVALNVFLAHSEIRYLDVPILIQQHIIQLQVTINDAAGVQEEQSDGDFGRVKPDLCDCNEEEKDFSVSESTLINEAKNIFCRLFRLWFLS